MSLISRGLGIALATVLVVFFTSCQSLNKNKTTALPQKQAPSHPPILAIGYKPATPRQLTFIGENEQPSFAPDGGSFLYVSQNQSDHKQAQVYSMGFGNLKPQRLTYQNGNSFFPAYYPDGQRIIYSSSTDEDKENPPFIRDALKRIADKDQRTPSSTEVLSESLPPMEIYTSLLNGQEIKRVTSREGFDGQVHFHPDRGKGKGKDKFIFSSTKSGIPQLYTIELGKKISHHLSRKNQYEHQPQYSPDGKSLTWVRENQKTKTSQIMIGSDNAKKERVLTLRLASFQSPKWHPQGTHILYSSNLHDNNFELYISKTDGSCVQRLTYSWADEGQPAFSPDGKTILFTGNQSGANHIYTMAFQPPQTCPESVN